MKTSTGLARAALVAALLVLEIFAGLSKAAAQARPPPPDRIQFNFSGYGNPQRPFPGYVGPFQLGPVNISGSGVIAGKDGKLLSGGRIVHSADLRDRRYPFHRTQWQVVKGLDVKSLGDRTVLKLQVRVVSSSYPMICPVGTLGVLELIDDKQRLANHHTGDGIRTQMPIPSSAAPDGGDACRTYVHGMNNADYSWTEPPRGGPGGGIWANVQIGGSGGTILGRWRQKGTQSNVNFTQQGQFIVGHIQDVGTLAGYGFTVGEMTFRLRPAGGNRYSGQVKWRSTDGRQWWQETTQVVSGNQMQGAGDWTRVR